MAQFSLRDFKKQASFFLRERLNDARLVLTDVSRIQLLTEEATNEDPWGPETKTMAMLADSAFELEEYDRIVQVIHNRLDGSKQRPWRQLYKTLVVLKYLLTHGPASIGKEFKGDIFCIEDLSQFSFTDQEGIDKGSMVRKAAERVLELLNNPDLWKEERFRAKKLSFGIRGFGSSVNEAPFQDGSSVNQAPLQDVTQGEEEGSAEGFSLLSNRSSEQIASVDSADICRGPSDKPSSMSFQPKQNSSTKDWDISVQTFKKSLSGLGSFRERLPQLSRQAVGREDGATDSEEVSISLLNAEENEGPSRQGAQGESTELVCRLVTC